MIAPSELFNLLQHNDISFFAGVPDSLLKNFCAYVTDSTSSMDHIITANEGAAVALGAGYHLATGKIPLIYLQNSGLGNTINPLLSLADREVYSIPMIIMIGWRGEPGKKDEPQHVKQGRVQNALLEAMEIPYVVIGADTDITQTIPPLIQRAKNESQPVALVVSEGSFSSYSLKEETHDELEMNREDAVCAVLDALSGDEVIVSTTGKTSREVYEYRVAKKQGHQNDFLTVGSMGHASQIALGIALFSSKKVVCLDGDGAVLMHMGSLAVNGIFGSKNFVHVLVNNGAHDSVGGQPTVGFQIDFGKIAIASGYKHVASTSSKSNVATLIGEALSKEGPALIEIKTRKGARENLGRPKTTPIENKIALTNFILGK